MKIGFMSDLHLEFCSLPKKMNDDTGDVLILLGDVTSAQVFRKTNGEYKTDNDSRKARKKFEELYEKYQDKYKHILMLMGNHDHYRGILANSSEIYREYFEAHGMKIQILEGQAHSIDDVIITGTTLWTDFKGRNPLVMMDAQDMMNDYRVIGQPNDPGNIHEPWSPYVTKPINAELILQEHDASMSILKQVLDANPDKKVVVATHHAPSPQSLNRKHSGNGLDGAYYTDLQAFIASSPNIKVWMHGHTHQSVDYMIEGTRVVANQCGYDHEECRMLFTGPKIIEV